MKTLLLSLLISTTVFAKTVTIDIYKLGEQRADRVVYTVDPRVKVWKMRNVVFSDFGLDKARYAIVRESRNGYKILFPDKTMGHYGERPSEPVRFYVMAIGPRDIQPEPHPPSQLVADVPLAQPREKITTPSMEENP